MAKEKKEAPAERCAVEGSEVVLPFLLVSDIRKRAAWQQKQSGRVPKQRRGSVEEQSATASSAGHGGSSGSGRGRELYMPADEEPYVLAEG